MMSASITLLPLANRTKSMSRIDAVLFDLDGTLLDTAPDFHRIMVAIQTELGHPPVDYAHLRTGASDGSRAMFKLAYGDSLNEALLESLVDQFLTHYAQAPVVTGELFPGISELLEWLESESRPWGVVTNKPRHLSERVMEDLGLSNRCSVLICPEDVNQAKPSPEGLLLAAERLATEPQHCLYLGDHQRDITAGKHAGMLTLACSFGYLKPDEKATDWGADLIVERSDQLTHLIRSLTV